MAYTVQFHLWWKSSFGIVRAFNALLRTILGVSIMGVIVRKSVLNISPGEKRMCTVDEDTQITIARRKRNGYYVACKLITLCMQELISSVTADEIHIGRLIRVMNFTDDFGHFPEDLASLEKELYRTAAKNLYEAGYRQQAKGSNIWTKKRDITKWLSWA